MIYSKYQFWWLSVLFPIGLSIVFLYSEIAKYSTDPILTVELCNGMLLGFIIMVIGLCGFIVKFNALTDAAVEWYIHRKKDYL